MKKKLVQVFCMPVKCVLSQVSQQYTGHEKEEEHEDK